MKTRVDSLLAGVNTKKVLQEALTCGGEWADLFAEEKIITLLELEDGRVERVVQGQRAGAGVRLLHSFHTAYSYTDLISTPSLWECARVVKSAVKSQKKKLLLFPQRRRWKKYLLPVAEPPDHLPLKAKLNTLWKIESAARKTDPRVKQVRVVYGDTLRRTAIADSHGHLSTQTMTYIFLQVSVVAQEKTELQASHESLGGTSGWELFTEIDAEEIAIQAARRAIRNLKARPAPAGPMTVVLAAEAGGTMIHEAVGHGLEADLAEEGLSVYSHRLGEKVASSLITVLDDATLAGRRGSFLIDDEGSPAQSTILIQNGVLKNYLYDRRLAMKYNRVSTGNGRRQSYEFPPLVRMTNTLIAPGKDSPEKILRSVDRGLLVKKMAGGEVNTVSGDFVFDVDEGYLIEKGEVTVPVRGATLKGNGPLVLQDIDMVGSDLGFAVGTCGKDGQAVPVADGQPTLRIPELIVGGRID